MALKRLAGSHPFHVSIIEKFALVPRRESSTLGVSMADNGIVLYYNPMFVADLPVSELGGVLLHVVHHVLFEHVVADPTDFPDPWARMVAEEITANEFVNEPLPAGAITLADFPGLPRLESTRQRYDRLKREQFGGATATTTQDNTRGSSAKTSTTTQETRGHPSSLTTLDDHTLWSVSSVDRHTQRAVIRRVVKQALVGANIDKLPIEIRRSIENLGIGLNPGNDLETLAANRTAKVNWQSLLRSCIGQSVRARPVFNRPPRRFPELAGIVPAQSRRATKPKLMAIVDTSASMTEVLLADISAELTALGRTFEVLVVECDAAVQRVYPFRRAITEVNGRGGTDLRPPLKGEFLRAHRPDVIIYFTDGLGKAPKGAPVPPVIWCIVGGGRRPAAWGRVVQI
jgi:predicted metal-dependent peptidase